MIKKAHAIFWAGLCSLILILLSTHAQAGSDWILLIRHPDLWCAPEKDAPHAERAWEAGKRLHSPAQKMDAAAPAGWVQVEADSRAGWLPEAYVTPSPPLLDPQSLRTIGRETVDRYHGLGPDYIPPDLTPVGPTLEKNFKPQMRREAAAALRTMIAAARGAGVKLYVISGYRPWTKQQELYERRVRENGWDQKTVAKPGHSEHQLGTAVDLGDDNSETLLKSNFADSKAGRWLRANAWTYGFAISFTRHNEPRTGIAPEPWHYRYWGPGQASARHRAALGCSSTAQ